MTQEDKKEARETAYELVFELGTIEASSLVKRVINDCPSEDTDYWEYVLELIEDYH